MDTVFALVGRAFRPGFRVAGRVTSVPGVGKTTLFATTNWIFMFMRAHGAKYGPFLAAFQDGSSEGPDNRSADFIAAPTTPAIESPNTVSVDESGRTIDVVIRQLASVPVELARLIEGRTLDQLAQPAQDGGWGLVEILPHFRDWERITGQRVSLILEQDAPALEEYDDSLWAIEHSYSEQEPKATFEEFRALREALVERLQALEPDDWNRVGILPKHGPVTLHWLMSSVCSHDAKHVVQARDVLA